ncbi:MAG TPA: hypothetical protein VKY85_10195 [Candidatus Angelobacter sp.]|nr:hypothetical protein [Candidatus Angelobacter sp.]
MVKAASHSLLLMLALLLTATAGLAQQAAPVLNTRAPVEVEDNFLQASGAQAHFEASNKMSDQANLFLAQDRIISVPHFNNSFAFQGKPFRYTVVGHNPRNNQTTTIPTQIVPISLFFEGYVDAEGKPIVLEVAPNLSTIVNSPNFRAAQYPTGYLQFGDAVQRAQFFHAMAPEWHTVLDAPQVLRPVNIWVPRGSATLYRMRSTGAIFAVVDEGFFISQINTIIQFEEMDVSGLPIALTANVFLAPAADIRKCCVMGFHTSFDAGERDDLQLVQTFIWASWISPGIFGGTVADVTAMSHEISEWLNDPFSTNIVPEWQFPTGPAGCQNNLETGDPMSASPHAGYPVIIDNYTYHPQNETLLQWFQRKTPSDAIDRAYSFPDETLLTSPAQGCASR